MSNAAPQSGEPTMEEILASIRRIISEEDGDPALKADEPPPPAAAPLVAKEAPPPPEEEEEVLELTNIVNDEPPPQPAPKPRPVLVSPVDDIAFETPAPAPAPILPEPETLVSGDTRDRAASAFDRLERNVNIVDIPSPTGNSLEGMVRTMMMPLLKQWLDDHLPTLVERIVQEEVERVANRRR